MRQHAVQLAIASLGMLLLAFGFQNCSPVKFQTSSSEGGNGFTVTPTGGTVGGGGGGTTGVGCAATKAQIILLENSPQALNLSGHSVLKARSISIRGSYNISGDSKMEATEVKSEDASIVDPLIKLAAPSEAGMSVFAGGSISATTVTLSPGVYKSGLNISGQAKVTMKAGIYILKNGLNISGNSELIGEGILLYIVSGGIDFSGDSTVRLSAKTSGNYANLLIFQDRQNPARANMSGGSDWAVDGVIYMASAHLSLSGKCISSQPASVIAASLSMSGGTFAFGDTRQENVTCF